MRLIYALIRYDLLMQARERGTWMLLAAAFLLGGFGLVEGQRFEANAEASRKGAITHELSAQSKAQALATHYFANPEAPNFAGLLWFRTPVDIRGYAFREHVGYAVKPAVAGAAMAIGQADLLPSYVRVRGESLESVSTTAEIEHPGRLTAGRYDLMFFVIYLWPLILLSLAVSVLTQERETGRLRNLQLQGLTPLRLLVTQVGGRMVAATVMLTVFCSALALIVGAIRANMAGLAALGSWALIVLAYSAFWGAVALAICALCSDRKNASFAAFGAWLVFAIVLPGLLNAFVQLRAPMPNREYYVQAMRDASDKVTDDKLNSLARFYDSHPEWRPVKTSLDKVSSSVSRIQRAQELELAMRGVEDSFEEARLRRDALYQSGMVLSPVTLAYQTFSRVAGNDELRQQQFLAEVKRHHGMLRDFFQSTIQAAALAEEESACAKTCLGGYGFNNFAAVPRFTPSTSLSQAPPVPRHFFVIFAWIAALAGLAYLTLQYFDSNRNRR